VIEMADSEIHVSETGEGAPVLLVHSSGLSGDQWRRTTAELVSDGKRVFVPDLLGCGRSPAWPAGTPLSFSDDLAVLDPLLAQIHETHGPVHLVGHSYGGLLALRLAVSHPARIRTLCVYDPVAFGVLGSDDADARADLDGVSFGWGSTVPEQEAWLRGFVDYWGGPGAWQKLSARVRAEMLRVGWVAHEEARSLLDDATPKSAYRTITAPILLVGGERSPIAARRVLQRLAEVLPNARLATLADAGHMGPISHVQPFNALLRAHLAA